MAGIFCWARKAAGGRVLLCDAQQAGTEHGG
jgi:hypothetical protein